MHRRLAIVLLLAAAACARLASEGVAPFTLAPGESVLFEIPPSSACVAAGYVFGDASGDAIVDIRHVRGADYLLAGPCGRASGWNFHVERGEEGPPEWMAITNLEARAVSGASVVVCAAKTT